MQHCWQAVNLAGTALHLAISAIFVCYIAANWTRAMNNVQSPAVQDQTLVDIAHCLTL